jgi:hypothetical protein
MLHQLRAGSVVHCDISLCCKVRSLPGHSGHRAGRTNQARFKAMADNEMGVTVLTEDEWFALIGELR